MQGVNRHDEHWATLVCFISYRFSPGASSLGADRTTPARVPPEPPTRPRRAELLYSQVFPHLSQDEKLSPDGQHEALPLTNFPRASAPLRPPQASRLSPLHPSRGVAPPARRHTAVRDWLGELPPDHVTVFRPAPPRRPYSRAAGARLARCAR